MRAGTLVMVLVAAWAGFQLLRGGGAVAPAYCPDGAEPEDGTIIMLTTTWCGYCARARRFLSEAGVAYCEYDTEQSARGAALYRRFGGRGVPVIIAGDRVQHGFSEPALSELVRALR